MFSMLQQRWKVNGKQLFLILCTFAIGGSLCGYLARKLLITTDLEKGTIWVFLYVLLMTLLWPICVLLVSIPFGQYNFFLKYLIKIWLRISGKKMAITRVAIYASGAGSNAQKIIDHFRNSKTEKISLIVCNNPTAGVLNIASDEKIAVLHIQKKRFYEGDGYLDELKAHGIDFIVLAGFLWKVPVGLINNYQGKIINIHPALLPKYGGKGMYGDRIHKAVIAAGDKESGITIHYVDEMYDHGNIIYQATCKVDNNDTPETLASKIHVLEHRYYPEIISQVLQTHK